MSRNTGSVASSDTSWLKLYAAVAVLPLALAACGGGGGGDSPPPAPTPPAPAPQPPAPPPPAPSPGPGTTWTNVTVTGAGNLVGVDYDDGYYVAVSDTGTAIASTDAATWSPVTLLTSNVTSDHLQAYTINHVGTTLVAAGSVSSSPYTTFLGVVATSADGVTWTMGSLPIGATPIHGLIPGARLVGLGETGHLYFSTNNGQTWSVLTTLSSSNGGTVGTLNAGAYTANKYVGVGDAGFITFSTSGTVWETGQVVKDANGNGIDLHGVTWTGTQFVAVGDSGAISTSADGTTWSSLRTSALTGSLRSVSTSSSGTIVVVGDNGIETSTDGNTWTAANASGVAALDGVTFGNGAFVAVGGSSTVKTSSN